MASVALIALGLLTWAWAYSLPVGPFVYLLMFVGGLLVGAGFIGVTT